MQEKTVKKPAVRRPQTSISLPKDLEILEKVHQLCELMLDDEEFSWKVLEYQAVDVAVQEALGWRLDRRRNDEKAKS
tara:strand:+ start:36 stop:266 length:231 start_codon:yes stop_codon:yes gene_type:complete